MNTQPQQQNEAVQTAYLYLTVKQFCERNPAFTLGGMRHQIFHEESNGLKKSGAIVRNGRKVLINESKYFQWLESKNQLIPPFQSKYKKALVWLHNALVIICYIQNVTEALIKLANNLGLTE